MCCRNIFPLKPEKPSAAIQTDIHQWERMEKEQRTWDATYDCLISQSIWLPFLMAVLRVRLDEKGQLSL